MSKKNNNAAFTVIEILVALTIIMAIVSMVYGSYAATTRSIDACNTQLACSERAHLVLRLMARQIRCAYVPPSEPNIVGSASPGPNAAKAQTAVEALTHDARARMRRSPVVFRGNSRDPRGDILSFITTSGLGVGPNAPRGLSHISYQYDQTASVLSISSEDCVDPLHDQRTQGHVQPVLRHVTSIELGFHDGLRWRDEWRLNEAKKLPRAVKVVLVVTDKSGRQHRYATAIPIMCQKGTQRKDARRDLASR